MILLKPTDTSVLNYTKSTCMIMDEVCLMQSHVMGGGGGGGGIITKQAQAYVHVHACTGLMSLYTYRSTARRLDEELTITENLNIAN